MSKTGNKISRSFARDAQAAADARRAARHEAPEPIKFREETEEDKNFDIDKFIAEQKEREEQERADREFFKNFFI